MIFTHLQLINICSPYKFVDILMTEILKVVEKWKIYQNKGRDLPNFEDLPQGCQGGGMVMLEID